MVSEPENLCSFCGADIRPGTSFCYKCGESLAPSDKTIPVPAEGGKAIVSNAWFKEDISSPEETVPAGTGEPEFQDALPGTGEIPPEENEENSEQAVVGAAEATGAAGETDAETEPEIKPVLIRPKEPGTRPASAAALRRKPKLQREKIEMVWEAPENGSNPMFIIGTIVIFVAVLLILLGVYLMK